MPSQPHSHFFPCSILPRTIPTILILVLPGFLLLRTFYIMWSSRPCLSPADNSHHHHFPVPAALAQTSLSICNWLWLGLYVYFICYHVSPFIFVPLDYKLNMNKDGVPDFLCNFLHASYTALCCQWFINATNCSSNFYSDTCIRCGSIHRACV